MIIDKILAQGEYIEKQDGINQKYNFILLLMTDR
jgi:hypothetical protein